jgi:hypothetical protein
VTALEAMVAVVATVAAALLVPRLMLWSLDRYYRRAVDKARRRIAQDVWDAHHNRKDQS